MHDEIDIKHLSFAYDSVSILQKVNLTIQRGEFLGIMGPNGGGKTTFLKLLMGFLTPTHGSIRIFGKKPEEARLKIGYVPQVHKIDRDFPITLQELVLLGALSKTGWFGTYPKEIKAKAMALIDLLGLTPHKDKAVGSLSGGLAQRALLARALLTDPDLLLLDEPTANIDAKSTAQIFEFLESMKGKKTILIVTHDLKTIIERVDRVLCVQDQITSLLPKDVCEHFAFGLYHSPLLDLKKESDALRVH
jgi:zinc transport system ATP-binding protein